MIFSCMVMQPTNLMLTSRSTRLLTAYSGHPWLIYLDIAGLFCQLGSGCLNRVKTAVAIYLFITEVCLFFPDVGSRRWKMM
jgi:hypothetical protein